MRAAAAAVGTADRRRAAEGTAGRRRAEAIQAEAEERERAKQAKTLERKRAKKAATNELAGIMGQRTLNLNELQQAITKAQKYGVDTTEAEARLDKGRKTQARKRAKKKAATEELASATRQKSIPKLEEAIAQAKHHGVDI